MSVENTSNVEQVAAPSTSKDECPWDEAPEKRWERLNHINREFPRKIPIIVEGPYTPEYATDGSAGFDLRAYFNENPDAGILQDFWELAPGQTKKIPTGLKFKIPHGYEIQIRPRSGLASQGIVAQFGTVDSDYRGEVSVILHNQSNTHHLVQHGDRIAQGVLAPVTRAYFVEGQVTADTDRGEGGFGSTGN